ncbi:MAG: T9SS type A sorting domain-containing protein [Prevotella sp.]|nr:T9SS type A sorting domain-containing protein [Prevotella sp.]
MTPLEERNAKLEQISPSGERQAAPAGDGCIYDLQGRLVATKDMVEDGSWQYRLSPGIYILNGKKFTKR